MDLDRLSPEDRRQALCAWLDGESTPEEARAVQSWLAAHPEEARALERSRRVWDLLGAYADEPVPAGFAARILEVTSGATSGTAGRPRRFRVVLGWKPLAAAAALVLAIGAAVRFTSRDEAPTSAPTEFSSLLETVPPDVLEQADVLLSLSEEEFAALLEIDPDEIATSAPQGG
jgi:anti-sigma factor RsiW